jgi:Protein of unknown function (DUF3592)
MTMSLQSGRRGAAVALVIALVGLPYGVYRLWDAWSFTSQAREAIGEIVERDSSQFTIRYAAEGRTFQITENLPSTKGMSGLKRAELQPGVEVTVLYDPVSPQNARWKSDRVWAFPIAVILVSVLAGLAGLFPDVAFRSLQ